LLISLVLLVAGMALVLWGAEKFTDGAVRTATRFGLSTFYIGAAVSGFEPENLVTGGAAAIGNLPQIALGTVVGSAVFMLTTGLGVALMLVPMEVRIPRAGAVAMIVSLLSFAIFIWPDGDVSRVEGVLLLLVAAGLMVWLYRASPVFKRQHEEDDTKGSSGIKVIALLALGTGVMVAGAELVVQGVRGLLTSVMLSETFLGMAVVGMGESLEEAARMVTPARRGHPELAWGNVVGTIVVLLTFNLGVIALLRPVTADPFVLRFHVPYLALCTLIVATVLLAGRKVGRRTGAAFVVLYVVYLAVNLANMWG
jgi:cation:H+ antiporter